MPFIEVKLNANYSDNCIFHITEMIQQGTNMGIIKDIKLFHSNPNVNKTTQKIFKRICDYQEKCIETLKEIFINFIVNLYNSF